MLTIVLVALLSAGCASAPKTCEPPCAKGQDCAKWEQCSGAFGLGGCSEGYRCEGTPDDCRTNGCPESDDLECRWEGGNAYACAEKFCYSRPESELDWTCSHWAEGKENCCHGWGVEEE